jgi:hypothetical protein
MKLVPGRFLRLLLLLLGSEPLFLGQLCRIGLVPLLQSPFKIIGAKSEQVSGFRLTAKNLKKNT